MNKEISTKTAVATIEEWGVDCDNFVAHNSRQFLVNGEPSDNSIEVGEFFLGCLAIVCALGIEVYHKIRANVESK